MSLTAAIKAAKHEWLLGNINDPSFREWHWWCLSINPNITWDIVQANPNKPWDWRCLSWNPNITWDIVQANPDKPWRWMSLSSNPNITWDIVRANPDKDWDWGALSNNPQVTWDVVQANLDKPWGWSVLSLNSNVLRYPLAEIERNAWRFIAAWRIQRAFKKAYSNPEYKMCCDRLMREFAGMAKDL